MVTIHVRSHAESMFSFAPFKFSNQEIWWSIKALWNRNPSQILCRIDSICTIAWCVSAIFPELSFCRNTHREAVLGAYHNKKYPTDMSLSRSFERCYCQPSPSVRRHRSSKLLLQSPYILDSPSLSKSSSVKTLLRGDVKWRWHCLRWGSVLILA